MATFDYQKTQNTATRLLRRFGNDATLTRSASSSYDPATGTSTDSTYELTVTASVFDYPKAYIDGTLILQGDKRAYVSAYNVDAPEPSDTLTWNGVPYRIISVKDLNPAGSVSIMYELQLRTQ